jgi:hypothetical protein
MKKTYNKEIEFYDIIYSIYKYWWIIFISSIISLILGYAYISKSTNNHYNYNLEINYLSDNEIKNYYAYLNKFDLINITEDMLMNEFIREFNSRKALKVAFSEIDYFEKTSNNVGEIDDKIENLINNIKLILVNSNLLDQYKIQYTGEFNNKFSKGINLALKNIQDNRRKNLKTYIDNQLNILKASKKDLVSDAELMIENIKKDYLKQSSRKINHLKEQLQLARELNISKINSSNHLNFDKYEYLRGYLAIEKEIEIITNRSEKESESHMSGLSRAENNLRKLLQDKNISRADDAYKQTPIYNDKLIFKLIDYDISNLKIEEKGNKNKLKLLLTFLVLAMTLSSFCVVFFSYYKNIYIKK